MKAATKIILKYFYFTRNQGISISGANLALDPTVGYI